MAKSFNIPSKRSSVVSDVLNVVPEILDVIPNTIKEINDDKDKKRNYNLNVMKTKAQTTKMMVDNVINSVDSIVNIIQTIGEERRKTEELKLQGIKIHAEIQDRISARENETVRILKKHEIALKQLENEIISIESQSKKEIKQIEFQMQQSAEFHQQRMKLLEIIENMVNTALEQYRFYRNDVVSVYQNTYVVDTNLLNSMNNTIQQLTLTVAQANNGRSLTVNEGE